MQDSGLSQALTIPALFYVGKTPLILSLYILFLVVGTVERSASTFAKKRFESVQSKIHELWLIVPFYGYLGLVILSILEFIFRVQTINLLLSGTGFVIYLAGVFFRRKAIAGLGDNWSLHTEIRQGHELVTDGIYGNIKHPYYLAVICELLGACLVANAVYTALLVVFIQLPLLIVRINLEETLLFAHFGEKYQNYSRKKLL